MARAGGRSSGTGDLPRSAVGRRRRVRDHPPNWDDFQADIEGFIDAGEHIIVTGHFRGRAKGDGGLLDAEFAHLWRMRDGKAIHFTNYADTMMWARALGKA